MRIGRLTWASKEWKGWYEIGRLYFKLINGLEIWFKDFPIFSSWQKKILGIEYKEVGK